MNELLLFLSDYVIILMNQEDDEDDEEQLGEDGEDEDSDFKPSEVSSACEFSMGNSGRYI